MFRKFLVVAAMTAGLAACGGAYYGGGRYVSVYSPPPAPLVYGRPYGYAPGPGYVWVSPYYDWRGNSWARVDGRWVRPPRRGSVWVAPSYEFRSGRHYYRHGYWR
jgi:hypothetical protein